MTLILKNYNLSHKDDDAFKEFLAKVFREHIIPSEKSGKAFQIYHYETNLFMLKRYMAPSFNEQVFKVALEVHDLAYGLKAECRKNFHYHLLRLARVTFSIRYPIWEKDATISYDDISAISVTLKTGSFRRQSRAVRRGEDDYSNIKLTPQHLTHEDEKLRLAATKTFNSQYSPIIKGVLQGDEVATLDEYVELHDHLFEQEVFKPYQFRLSTQQQVRSRFGWAVPEKKHTKMRSLISDLSDEKDWKITSHISMRRGMLKVSLKKYGMADLGFIMLSTYEPLDEIKKKLTNFYLFYILEGFKKLES